MSDTLLDTTSATAETAASTNMSEAVPPSSDWRSAIPAEYAKEPFWNTNLKDKGLGDVLKTTIEAQKKLGGAIFLPSEKDKPEDRAKKITDIYGKLGRPESPDKYSTKPPPLPEGAQWDTQRETAFKTAAHALNLTGAQVQGVLDWYGKEISTAVEQQGQRGVQMRKETEAALQNEWGGAYQHNVVLAQRATEKLAEDAGLTKDESAQLVATVGNDSGFLKMMAKLGTYFRNDRLITGEAPSTQDSIQTQINDLMKKGGPYWDRTDPSHEEVKEKVRKLFESHTNPMAIAMREG